MTATPSASSPDSSARTAQDVAVQAQLDLANERLSHLQTIVQQSVTKKDMFVFFLCLMLMIFSGGFVIMYRIDKLGATSNLHWASDTLPDDYQQEYKAIYTYDP